MSKLRNRVLKVRLSQVISGLIELWFRKYVRGGGRSKLVRRVHRLS